MDMLRAYQYAAKNGAPSLALRIALNEFKRTKNNGDIVKNAQWCHRAVIASQVRWDANDALVAGKVS